MTDKETIELENIIKQPERLNAPDLTSSTSGDVEKQAEVQKMSIRESLHFTLATKEGLIGNYDYGWLCTPVLPWKCGRSGLPRRNPPFFGLNDHLPTLLAIILGLQHALAMIGGLVTPPIILSGPGSNNLNLDASYQSYMVSAAMITSGLLSLIQITSFKLGKYQLGTGLVSVVGTSFSIIPVAQGMFSQMYKSGYCPTVVESNGVIDYLACPQAWGALLGTVMITFWVEIVIAFLPHKVLRKVFPPIVTGTTLFLIGASLITAGAENWAGGTGPCMSRPTSGYFSACPNIVAPQPLPWGSGQFIGLGFSVFFTILLVEIFGSPFMRSAQVLIGLAVGYIIAAATGYVDASPIVQAPWVNFLWVKTFPISIYPPAIIPLLVTFAILAVETIGDVTASCDVSRVEVVGEPFEKRISGGVFADGINAFFAALMTCSPLSTFAQNNGVIALTRCANRTAGYCACGWLIFLGIFSKFAGVIAAIPASVLGGMTSFLFATVATSGIRILAYLKWTRRDRFIAAAALTLGLGVELVPTLFSYSIAYNGDNDVIAGLVASVNIILSTGFVLGAIISIILNLVIPEEEEETLLED